MTPTDELRLATWLPEIISALLAGAQPRREGADILRWEGHGSLTVNTKTGFWRQWSAARSHWSALPLIELLLNCNRAEAMQHVSAGRPGQLAALTTCRLHIHSSVAG